MPLSGVLAVFIPLAVFLVAQIRIRSFWDLNNSVIGLLYSLILGTLCQVVIKVLIGGFRPYWLEVCRPDVTLAATNNQTGLNGVGFRQIMYTVDVCTNPNKGQLKTAMTSFPSGHSTAAAASAVFLFLWLNAKLKVWSNFQPAFGWLALTFAPLLLGALMCLTLTIDMAHHWYDILAGATIGSVSAVASYRANYAAIWDWRYNHIPLRRDRVVDYAGFSGDAALEDHILTGTGRHGRVKPGYLAKPVRPVHPLAEYYLIIRKPSLGWGRPRDVESRHERRLRKHASRRRGVEQASGEGPWAQSGVVGLPNGSPEMARSRDVRSHQLGGSEDMV